MDNLCIYNAVKEVPQEAKKPITGGRLQGKTDINPMWRIKALTEQFGPCGIGWYFEITKQWIEEGASSEKAAFCNINLFVKINDQWSSAIPGTGGSMLVAKEKGGLYTSDECHKMALTDAISVACKMLGVGANVYWEADKSKYPTSGDPRCTVCGEVIKPANKKDGNLMTATEVAAATKGVCASCFREANA